MTTFLYFQGYFQQSVFVLDCSFIKILFIYTGYKITISDYILSMWLIHVDVRLCLCNRLFAHVWQEGCLGSWMH